MEYLERQATKALHDYLQGKEPHSNTLLLGGARQVGKSSLVQHIIQNRHALLINLFESATLAERIDQTESFADFAKLLFLEFSFKPGQGQILVIDEAQESRRFGRWIRFFKEKWRNQKVIVMGSILSRLFEDESNYPVGRVVEYTLRPFNFHEFLGATGQSGQAEYLRTVNLAGGMTPQALDSLKPSYLKYLHTGGMPEVVTSSEANQVSPAARWEQLLRQYAMDVERYLGENFRSLFLSAVRRIAELTCYPSKNSAIVSTDSPFYRRLPVLLEIIDKWQITLTARVKTKAPESAGGYSSKKYLFDVGLANFLITHSQMPVWSERPEMANTVYGKLQENFVMTEIAALPNGATDYRYYKENHNSREVDFLLPLNGRWIPVEVKSQATINRNHLTPMINYLHHTSDPLGVLVYNGPFTSLSHQQKTILAIPPFLTSEIPRLIGEALAGGGKRRGQHL